MKGSRRQNGIQRDSNTRHAAYENMAFPQYHPDRSHAKTKV
jgi:hypothetical protein